MSETETTAAKTDGQLAWEAHDLALFGPEHGAEPGVWAAMSQDQRDAWEAAAHAARAGLERHLGEVLADRNEVSHLNAGQAARIADLEAETAALTVGRNRLRDLAAEAIAAYERATRFDRTQTDEDRLAEWRAGLEPGQ